MKSFKQTFALLVTIGMFFLVQGAKEGTTNSTAQASDIPKVEKNATNENETRHNREVACYVLFLLKMSKDKEEVKKLIKAGDPKTIEVRREKMKALYYGKCISEIPASLAEKVLEKEEFDTLDTAFEPYVQIDYIALSKPEFNWNLTEVDKGFVELAEKAGKEIEDTKEQDKETEGKADEKDEKEGQKKEDEEEEDDDDENYDKVVDAVNEYEEISIPDLVQQRKTLGEEKYRLALCTFFAQREIGDDDVLHEISLNHTVTERRHVKLLAMMLGKCIKNYPLNIYGKEEDDAMENYKKYLRLGEEDFAKESFKWSVKTEEAELLKTALKLSEKIIEEQESAAFAEKSKKQPVNFTTWIRKNTEKVVAFCCVILALVFIVGLFYFRKSKVVDIDEEIEFSDFEDENKEKGKKKDKEPEGAEKDKQKKE